MHQQDAQTPLYMQNLIKRLVKVLVAAIFFAARGALRAASRLVGRPQVGLAVAVYYHQVPTVHRARFARQMDHLLRWAQPIRADHKEPLPAGRRCVMVTADDGWISFIENALPELQTRHIPVTIFVIADHTGDGMGEADDRIVSEEELRGLFPDIVRGLVTIGSHSSTHARVTTLDRHEAWRELADSRTRLQEILNREVKLFCFPFSSESAEAVEMCRAAGYTRAFGGMPAPALGDPLEFLTGRIRVDPTDWLVEFHLKLMGAYDWVPFAAYLKRRSLNAFSRMFFE